MGVQSQSALIAALLLLALGVNVAFSERRVEHRAAFASLLVAFFSYNLTWFLYSVTDSGFWLRLLLLSGVGVAQACLWFFGQVLAGAFGRSARTVVHVASLTAVVLVGTDLVYGQALRSAIAALALGTYAACVWHLYRRYRAADGPVESTRMGYLVLGGAISVIASAADLLPAAGIPFPSLGHLWTTVYMYFWMQVIQRSRLLDLKELLGRGLALIVLSAIISLIYIALLVWVGGSLGLFFFNTLAASVVLFFVFEPLKRVIDVWVGRLLFHETYVLQGEIRALRRALANVIDIAELAERVPERLRASRRVTHAAVFFLEGGGRGYSVPGPPGAAPRPRLDVVRDRAFLDLLTRERIVSIEQVEREILDLDAADDSPERARWTAVRKTMERISAGVALALASEDRLVGVLAVRDDRTREAFSTYELKLLAELAAQMAIVVENSEIVQRLKERDRLSAVGEMATGMAHEIRNPLGAIKSAAQLLGPTDVDPESREFVEVIVEEADRLDHVLRQFLDFARPYRGDLQPMKAQRVVERVATLMRAEEHDGPVQVQVELEPELPAVIGDADQLHQVVLNLARNAAQAMEDGGTLTLGARLAREEQPGRPGAWRQRVEVFVRDTGPGIPEAVQANLFIPFFTTKRRGTGLGLPISQRLLQHHGSEIRVETAPGQGTTMSFRLFLEQEADQLTGEQRRLLAGPRSLEIQQPRVL